MARVEFDIGDDITALVGIAVVRGTNPDGKPVTSFSLYGELLAEEAIGMLTGLLDQLRANYVDPDYDIIADLFSEEDE